MGFGGSIVEPSKISDQRLDKFNEGTIQFDVCNYGFQGDREEMDSDEGRHSSSEY